MQTSDEDSFDWVGYVLRVAVREHPLIHPVQSEGGREERDERRREGRKTTGGITMPINANTLSCTKSYNRQVIHLCTQVQ